MSLERPLAYFRVHQEEFVKEHYGQFVIIHEDKVEGFFDDELDAYLVAKKKKLPPGSYLLRPCIRREEETSAMFRSRVAD